MKAARAIWKGSIELGELSIPVKLFAAVQDRQLHFHLLHRKDGARVQQRMIDPSTGKAVPRERVRRGFPVAPSEFVVLEPQELAALEPKPSRDIRVERSVPVHAVDPQWYDRPYYLGPDGPPARYFALQQALRDADRLAIVRWVMRKREYSGALAAHGDHLLLITLRDAAQRVDLRALQAPTGRAFDPRERDLAGQLVDTLAGDFEPGLFQDTYREQLSALIAAKARGNSPKLKPVPARKPSGEDLTRALRASLRHEKERKSA